MDYIFTLFSLPVVLYFHIKPYKWLEHCSNEAYSKYPFRSAEVFQPDWVSVIHLHKTVFQVFVISETNYRNKPNYSTQPISSCFLKFWSHLDQIPALCSGLCDWECLAACPAGLVMKSDSYWGTDDSILQNRNIPQKI